MTQILPKLPATKMMFPWLVKVDDDAFMIIILVQEVDRLSQEVKIIEG